MPPVPPLTNRCSKVLNEGQPEGDASSGVLPPPICSTFLPHLASSPAPYPSNSTLPQTPRSPSSNFPPFTMDVDLDPQTYLTQALSNPHLPQELKPFYEAFQRFYDNK